MTWEEDTVKFRLLTEISYFNYQLLTHLLTSLARLSDFHKLVVAFLKIYFPKQTPNIQTFRDYRIFQNNLFRSELDYELSKLDVCNLEFEHFLNIFMKVLNTYAPIKEKYLRANQGEFITKKLNKAIITRSRLCNKYLKEKSADSKIA